MLVIANQCPKRCSGAATQVGRAVTVKYRPSLERDVSWAHYSKLDFDFEEIYRVPSDIQTWPEDFPRPSEASRRGAATATGTLSGQLTPAASPTAVRDADLVATRRRQYGGAATPDDRRRRLRGRRLGRGEPVYSGTTTWSVPIVRRTLAGTGWAIPHRPSRNTPSENTLCRRWQPISHCFADTVPDSGAPD